MAEKDRGKRTQYLIIISPTPDFIILKLAYPQPAWRKMLAAITPLMHERGFRRKDIHAIEGLLPTYDQMNERDFEFEKRLEDAYAGVGERFAKHHLYEWRGDGFKLVRRPLH